MHSALINKIRILKPRKKDSPQQNLKKSFTINNDNCHSSIVLQSKKDDMPPPLEPPKNSEVENEPKDKWVPFYVVNVPQVGVGLSSALEPEVSKACSSSENNTESRPDSSPKRLVINVTNQNINSSNESISSYSQANESHMDVVSSQSNTSQEPVNTSSQRVTRPRLVKVNNSVNCFLCPTKFHSVQEMQDHYLENHKHKKRMSTNSVKSFPKKAGKSTTKLKDPLTLTEGDCTTGDGEPKCPICSIYFKTKEEVKSHMTNVHCYKCSECHNTFYTLFQFTDHRCAKFVKQKKPKLKKKKLKVVSSKEQEQDPLALPVGKYIKILPKNVPILPKTSYPVIIKYPVGNPVQSTPTHTLTSNTQTTIADPNISATNATVSTIVISNNLASLQSTAVKPSKSLLQCSLEELTSKEFNKMKLNEIIKNPNLSINWIPKKNQNYREIQEFFSCGRCNVLCEDKADYVEHLEECLRLSNVSLVSTQSPPQRILKLKSEVVPQRADKFTKTTINKKLLKELKGFIGTQNSELFNPEEENGNSSQNKKVSNPKSDFIHPDIKGNISITKIKPVKAALKNSGTKHLNLQENLMTSAVKMTQSVKYPISSTTTTSVSSQQPMVIIPLNNPIQTNQIQGKEEKPTHDEPDYPNISITDKSNSVTWNFIGSESGAVLRVESPFQEASSSKVNKIQTVIPLNSSTKILPSSSTSPESVNTEKTMTPLAPVSSSDARETELINMKLEPSSPIPCNSSDGAKNSPSSEECKDNFSSMELVLDEDEIKMEVEDEVVDDRF